MKENKRFTFKQFVQMENFWKRMAIMLPSVFFMGFSLSFLIEVGWGTDPASYFLLHFSNFINLSFGNTQVIVYTCMFVLVFFLGPKYIGFGTLSNMIFIGYISDFFRFIWNKIGYSQLIDSNFTIQIIRGANNPRVQLLHRANVLRSDSADQWTSQYYRHKQ